MLMTGQDKQPPEREVAPDLLATPRGEVELFAAASPAMLARLTMDERLANFRPAKKQKEALVLIAGLPEGRVSIARHGGVIVAYVTFHRPHRLSRWARHPLTLEVGGIEVSPAWRRCGIAGRLLRAAFAHPSVEERIVYTTEYYWHWDLRGNRLGLWEYREVMIRLFAAVGMEKTETDERDIAAHPANVLMVRYGKNVPESQKKAFRDLLFLGS